MRENHADSDDTSGGNLSRRRCLQGVAAGCASLGLLSLASGNTVAEQMQDLYDQYDRVIDVVEAGADNTGRESITPVLERHRSDNTLYVFPPGEYYMDKQFRFTGFENVGFVGNDATLVPADYDHFDDQGHGVYRLFRFGTYVSPGQHLRFSGFDVDQTAPETGIRVIDAVVDKELVVRDVHIDGQDDMGCRGAARFAVSDPDGTGIVERFEAPDGAAWIQNTPRDGEVHRGGTGILSNTYNRGTLLFKDCVLNAFPNTGLYAAWGSGQIKVEGGRYSNSNVAQIRLGGTDSYVRGAEIVVDETREYDEAQRGIRLEHGENVEVHDTDITITSPDPSNHAISVQSNCGENWIQDVSITLSGDDNNHGIVVSSGAGKTTVYRTDIAIDMAGGYGLWLCDDTSGPGAHVEEVNVTDTAGTDYGFRDAIRCERDGSEFRGVNVTQKNETRRNGLVITADDVLVYKGRYEARQFPIIDTGDDLWVESVYADSLTDEAAIQLYPGTSNVLIKESTLVGGIEDLGAEGLRTWGNEF